jgi:hypothetical protein
MNSYVTKHTLQNKSTVYYHTAIYNTICYTHTTEFAKDVTTQYVFPHKSSVLFHPIIIPFSYIYLFQIY